MTDKIEIPKKWRGTYAQIENGLFGEAAATMKLILKDLAKAEAERNEIVQIVKDACDRDWKDEAPLQVVTIAQNAMFWRNTEIQKLRIERDAALRENERLKAKDPK